MAKYYSNYVIDMSCMEQEKISDILKDKLGISVEDKRSDNFTMRPYIRLYYTFEHDISQNQVFDKGEILDIKESLPGALCVIKWEEIEEKYLKKIGAKLAFSSPEILTVVACRYELKFIVKTKTDTIEIVSLPELEKMIDYLNGNDYNRCLLFSVRGGYKFQELQDTMELLEKLGGTRIKEDYCLFDYLYIDTFTGNIRGVNISENDFYRKKYKIVYEDYYSPILNTKCQVYFRGIPCKVKKIELETNTMGEQEIKYLIKIGFCKSFYATADELHVG